MSKRKMDVSYPSLQRRERRTLILMHRLTLFEAQPAAVGTQCLNSRFAEGTRRYPEWLELGVSSFQTVLAFNLYL